MLKHGAIIITILHSGPFRGHLTLQTEHDWLRVCGGFSPALFHVTGGRGGAFCCPNNQTRAETRTLGFQDLACLLSSLSALVYSAWILLAGTTRSPSDLVTTTKSALSMMPLLMPWMDKYGDERGAAANAAVLLLACVQLRTEVSTSIGQISQQLT